MASWLQRKKEGTSDNDLVIRCLIPCSGLNYKSPAGEDLPILLQQAPKSQSQASATIIRGLLDPMLAGEPVTFPFPQLLASYRMEQILSRVIPEQSGAFLDNCQVLSLPYLDFPVGEESATALWKQSEVFVEAAGLTQVV